MTPPKTCQALFLRLQDEDNEEAWEEFVSIYRPVIYRMAVRKGLQSADAEDLSQHVLVSISKKISEWEHDPNRGRFRTWLQTVVKNAVINAITRKTQERGIGGTEAIAMFAQKPLETDDKAMFESEVRQEAFRHAADLVESEFKESTWRAFWLTSIEGMSPTDAAKELDKSVGSIYVSKSRVMDRIKRKVGELLPEYDESPGTGGEAS